MPNDGYFDTKRDNQLIAAGTHFFCEACIIARPLKDQSPDKRYCNLCHDFLLEEARLLPPKSRRADWIPQNTNTDVFQPPPSPDRLRKKEGVLSHTTQPYGRPKRELPGDKIREMATAGISSREIAGRLKAEYDINVSYKTVQRLLKNG